MKVTIKLNRIWIETYCFMAVETFGFWGVLVRETRSGPRCEAESGYK